LIVWVGADEFGMIFCMEPDWMVGCVYILVWDWDAW